VIAFLLLVETFFQESVKQALWQAIFAFIVGGLGVGVLRGEHRSPWGLVILQGFGTMGIMAQLVNRQPEVHAGFLLLKLVLATVILSIYTLGAMHVRRISLQHLQPQASESQRWARSLYEIAFLQATWIATLVLMAFFYPEFEEVFGFYFAPVDLIDVGLLAGFGYAAYKQQTWGGYGLVLYQLAGNIYVFTSSLELLPPTAISIRLSILAVYILGAFHLRKLKVAPTASVPKAGLTAMVLNKLGEHSHG
jgi:hypothetical protein